MNFILYDGVVKLNTKILLVAVPIVVAILIVLFHAQIAWNFVRIGNEFFGGSFPYNLAAADAAYTVALKLDPEVNDAWHQRARISFLRGNLDTALVYINTQIDLHGTSLMSSYYIRGLINGYREDYLPAETDFTTFILWDKTNWAAHNDLAWIFFSQGKFEEAEERSRGGLYIHPKNPWLLTTHAMALYNLGNKEGAKVDLRAAKTAAAQVTEADWIEAYPGNDSRIAKEGVASLKETIDTNLRLIEGEL